MNRDRQTDNISNATNKQVETVEPDRNDDENGKVDDTEIQGKKAGRRMRALQDEDPVEKIGGQSKKKLN